LPVWWFEKTSPWILSSIKPIQLSQFDFEGYKAARKQFSTEEWIDLLIRSIGFNPEMFGRRSKLLQLVRLIPYCERNYNLIELGPKGTGKSHIYSDFSPHGILISKLFVNNTTGKIGLVGYWDLVAFDEFAGKNKHVDKSLVDIMKNYMANKSFSRGVDTIGAEASMAFVGNTRHTLPYMLKHTGLFDELPDKYQDSAFLDRLHFYIPGWEIDIIRGEMFSEGYGFVVDYLAEILRSLRNHDYSQKYSPYFELFSDISTRDRDGINKTFSGLMKILFPHEEASEKEMEEILRFAVEGRRRVKDQLMRIDATYAKVRFGMTDKQGKETLVKTLEQEEYPRYYKACAYEETGEQDVNKSTVVSSAPGVVMKEEADHVLEEKHLVFQENQRGVSFDSLFGPYLKDAFKIVITDPYIRYFFQARNLMELLETIARQKPDDEEVEVHLVTTTEDLSDTQQVGYLEKMQESCASIGIVFSWEFAGSGTLHARHIITDHGWKILLDRGLDVFQPYEMKDAFAVSNRIQRYRSCKAFEVTFLKSEVS
jgi:ATP-dependent Lon protease